MTSSNDSKPAAPAVILVDPQLGENIGACARAMWNCGLDDLRLVRPRDGWPNDRARSAATGARRVVDEARLFETLADATSDLGLVLATSARPRDLYKPVYSPREAAAAVHQSRDSRAGLVFGCERTGLDNDDVALANALVRVPLNPQFTSLNLAQAVLLVAWEWFRAVPEVATGESVSAGPEVASGAEVVNFFEHLEAELDDAEFFRVPEKRAGMVRNLRNLITRSRPTSDEIRILHGVVSALVGRRKDGTPVRQLGTHGGGD